MQGVRHSFMSLQLGIIDALPEEHRLLYHCTCYFNDSKSIGPLVAVGIWNANNISLFAIVIIFIALTTTSLIIATLLNRNPILRIRLKMPFNAVTVLCNFSKIKSC